MHEKIVIIDFGSQYTQLIARRVRECNVYCEIYPYNKSFDLTDDIKGIIFSGSPFSVNDANALKIDSDKFVGKLPVLGICYGAQLLAQQHGGTVAKSDKREYGRSFLHNIVAHPLFEGVEEMDEVWMSHGDSIIALPAHCTILSATHNIPIAAYQFEDSATYCLQFHPEVTHSTKGKQIISNFLQKICGCHCDWSPSSFVEETVVAIRNTVGNDKVVLGLSGGVDSSVAALLLHRAIGTQLHCIFINNGLLRWQEYESVLESYNGLGLQVMGIDASEEFYTALRGLEDPEAKRKAIGRTFIEVFDKAAHDIKDVQWLAQGTIYPDIIESVSVHGPSAKIKSHHNVGGLPDKMHLKIIEPLNKLFKDEVRNVGKVMQLPENILHRHPFPGPGLAIRILGEVNASRVQLLQQADNIFIGTLKAWNLYNTVWQAGVILLPIHSVGVMGDERTYEQVVALRAVSSLDGMTADWCHLPYEFLAHVSNDIINNVKGINRVVYDISSKPPATIEWE